MDHNTAQNAQKLNAFVKVRPHDAFQHWSHGRITEFHGGNKAVVKCGSVLRKVYIEDIELDKSRNLSEGIIVEKSDEPNTAGDPWIILNLREWEGYTGSGWSQDENRWKHYDTIRHADAERD